MSEGTGAAETLEFARLLHDLKTRSGLSYGTLAKRLHTSTSTLHRYCSGTALPNEYASAERIARLCRATPDELVELHRAWILADAARSRRTDRAGEPPTAGTPVPNASVPNAPSVPTPTPAPPPDALTGPPDPAAAFAPAARTGPAAATEPPEGEAAGTPVVEAVAPPAPPRRRRTALIASAAALAVLTTAVIVVRPVLWGGDGSRAAGAGTTATAAGTGTDTGTDTGTGTTALPEPPPTGTATGTTATTAATSPTATPTPPDDAPAPLAVGTRPYVYADPCSQHFLVNSAPAQVGPPAGERDAPRWAAAYGAVSSDEQQVALTVQGTGAETVVLEALHVRITAKGAPLAWNDYAMGVGCGGEVETKSFDIDLDRGSPTITVKGGQRDFPYKVSASDPEVFYVTAHTKAHDVRWDLTLDWSSGSRRGTVRVDSKGLPFRTSANVKRPGFDYPLGINEWIKRTDG
ncbi:helix-turn-helix transcriptional regulator [Kitasatospora sp. NPDC048545]|uniref:helix-turn-helix domain-containing protein n=1 Tax=Kitasatospora sp. NPDC048545 TaxID=3157208 RepID=UPI0033F28898